MIFGGRRALCVTLILEVGCAKQLAPPTAAFSAPATAQVRVAVQLDGSASGPGPIVFRWELTAKPAGSTAALTNAGGPAPRFVPDLGGSYAVRLTVRDFANQSAPLSHTIVATEDCTPQIGSASVSTTSIDVGQAVGLTGSISAPCSEIGDPVVAVGWALGSATASSQGKIIGASRLDASIVPDVSGHYDVGPRASDALGFTSPPRHVLFNVGACGENRPQVDSLSATPSAPGLGKPVQLSASVSDADALPPCSLPRTFSFTWSFGALPAGSAAQLSDPA